jgi:hypothetical protein
MRRPEHRFTCFDLFAGNVSLSRGLLDAVGRFDEGFSQRSGEDYELGIRLLRRRARFRFVAEAATVHHDAPSSARCIQRAFAEGRGHVVIARKHPEMFTALPLVALLHDPPPPGVRSGLWPRSWGASVGRRIARLPVRAAERLGARRLWQVAQGAAKNRAYWRGVVEESGSRAALARLLQDVPLQPEGITELEVDLKGRLHALESILTTNRADALRLRYGNHALGRIPPLAGAEALRLPHVHHALAHWFGFSFLAALRESTLRARTAA